MKEEVKQKGILPDFIWGPAPKPPGFNALWTKAYRAGWLLPALPHASVTSHGARGASQQLPYPPGWWRDNTTVGKNIKTILLKGGSETLTEIGGII